jgi:hypothetical protein
MPDKVILNIDGNQGEVFVELDGKRHKLRKCKSVVIRADCDGVNEADLTLYTFDLASEITITRENAEAIMQVETDRQLAFLSDADVEELRKLRGQLHDLPGSGGFAAFDKLLAQLARREESPF